MTQNSMISFTFLWYKFKLYVSQKGLNIQSTFLFDHIKYFETLTWLGAAEYSTLGNLIKRSLPYDLQDARGSWPYQSLPTVSFLHELAESKKIVNFTSVIRPDLNEITYKTMLEEIQNNFTTSFIPLKKHLCHSRSFSPAKKTYSARTIKRLKTADKEFSVQRETFSDTHLIIADWQAELQKLRDIPLISSPDQTHFSLLAQLPPEQKDNFACLTLRKKSNGTLHGILLAGFDSQNHSWHAHSVLTTKYARSFFGTYLLFDETINLFHDCDIWFGGEPSGTNGKGVFNFKQRFSNMSKSAYLLSIDLVADDVQKLRANLGCFKYLPNYRDPMIDLRTIKNASHIL